MLCPETNPVILGHEALAASAVLATSAAVSLENAKGVLIVVTHTTGDNVDVTLTVDEGTTAALAVAGGSKVTTGAEFPIWVTLNAATTDVPVRQADALTYVIDADVLTGTCIVFFYISASKLTNKRQWVHLCSAGAASAIMSVHYILDGVRYPQASPLTAIA
jgi:hypothetical protein